MAVGIMSRIRKAIAQVLQAGPIPRHVAFIMDGNRRFADRMCSGDIASGHSRGFLKASSCMLKEYILKHADWNVDTIAYSCQVGSTSHSYQSYHSILEAAPPS